MINHSITYHIPILKSVRAPRDIGEKFQGIHGSTQHKRFIHRRSHDACELSNGSEVYYKGTVWYVQDILGPEAFDDLEWDGLSPKYIHLINFSGDEVLINPGMIKKGKRK